MSIKNGTTVDLTVTSASDPMSVDNNDDELVSTISPIETTKPSSKPATYNSSTLSYTARTVGTSALYPIYA